VGAGACVGWGASVGAAGGGVAAGAQAARIMLSSMRTDTNVYIDLRFICFSS
jgi:hypothetical protein